MALEYELKFKATPDILNAIRQAYSGEAKAYEMETTYYDTPSGAMAARYYTLRRRMENGISVCTLKTPAVGKGRQELETLCDSIEQAIPKLCRLGAPSDFERVVQEGLVPICGAKFTRLAIDVSLENCRLELALDQGSLLGGGRSLPLCEVEVELKEGTPADANRFAEKLAVGYGLRMEHKSKFRRALDLYKGEIL